MMYHLRTCVLISLMMLIVGIAGCGGDSPGKTTLSPVNASLSQSVTASPVNATATQQLRVAHFDLDPIYSRNDDAAQVESNIRMLVNRVRDLSLPGIDLVVYLSAFSNADASKKAYNKVFFPSAHLSERGGNLRFNDPELPQGQLFARTARAIKQAVPNVQVYAWMPTLNFRIEPQSPYFQATKNAYVTSDLRQEQNDPNRYARLSPFVGPVWDVVAQIYRELGWAAGNYIDGIVFHDDGILSDHEDVGKSAQAFLRDQDWSALVPGDNRRWDQLNAQERGIRKSRYLNQFSLYMARQAQDALNDKFALTKVLATARHVYSTAFTNPNAVQWLAQEPQSLLQDYDYVLIEAYPYMEARNNPTNPYAGATFCALQAISGCKNVDADSYFDLLFSAVKNQPQGVEKVVFVMQTVDWNTQTGEATDLSTNLIGSQMTSLFQKGAIHFGWYPDRYFLGAVHPAVNGGFNDALLARH